MDYPTRNSHHAHKVVRLLAKTCAAQSIGIDACWLVTTIAMCEDAKRYTGAVSYWNAQLQAILGFRKWDRLDKARRAAMGHGWLHYQAPPSGTRNVAPLYWSLVPSEFGDLDDSPTDEDEPGEAVERPPKRDTLAPSDPQKGIRSNARPYPAEGYGRGDARGEPPDLVLDLTTPLNPPETSGGLSTRFEDVFGEVAAAWLEHYPHARLGREERRRVGERLAEGFDARVLILAQRGYRSTEPARPSFRAVYRSADAVSKWVAVATPRPRPRVNRVEPGSGKVRRAVRDLVAELGDKATDEAIEQGLIERGLDPEKWRR